MSFDSFLYQLSGSLLNLRQSHLPQFASVYSAVNEYQHCWEDEGLASCPGGSNQLHYQYNDTMLLASMKPGLGTRYYLPSWLPNVYCLGDDFSFTYLSLCVLRAGRPRGSAGPRRQRLLGEVGGGCVTPG